MACDCCDNACCNCMWKYYSPFVRTSGVIVAGGLWAIGITQVSWDPFFIYIMFAAFIVSFLELLIFINPCCHRCCNREGRCYAFWEYMSWLDNWKRAILYLLLSVFCYIRYNVAWAIVSGAILDVLALIYIIRTYRMRPEDDAGELPRPGGPASSTGHAKTYGRFETNDNKTVSSGTASSVSSAPMSEKEKKRLENEARYPGGNVVNPFEEENKEKRDRDDDVIPEGDAGLMRYPP